eukprot:Nitzschia sp. Nitz4//scaffold125_size66327//39968//41549//NITZ4_006133-RA/size66327-augustus-gene-0.8-mRNA-1//-1//CDS//3329534619//2823//frame0
MASDTPFNPRQKAPSRGSSMVQRSPPRLTTFLSGFFLGALVFGTLSLFLQVDHGLTTTTLHTMEHDVTIQDSPLSLRISNTNCNESVSETREVSTTTTIESKNTTSPTVPKPLNESPEPPVEQQPIESKEEDTLLDQSLEQQQQQQQEEEEIPEEEEAATPFSDFGTEFDPSTNAVIVTKIQGSNTVKQLNQSLCLLTAAYNCKVNYDIVVFTATAISEQEEEGLKTLAAPANLTVVVDNPGLHAMVDALPEDRKQALLARCDANKTADLQWTTKCTETTSSHTTYMPIQYNWQAEFRSLHIWNHPAIAKYRYMLWMDSDGMCSLKWKRDPVALVKQNNLALLFDHFPVGRANGEEFVHKTREAFGYPICEIVMRNGTLQARTGKCKHAKHLRQIYGFFHVTDLSFYRSDPVMKWLRILIGDAKFSRQFDDQVAVTIPAAALASNRSWHMPHFGLRMGVVHNNRLDGRADQKLGQFQLYWKKQGKELFPEGDAQCNVINQHL